MNKKLILMFLVCTAQCVVASLGDVNRYPSGTTIKDAQFFKIVVAPEKVDPELIARSQMALKMLVGRAKVANINGLSFSSDGTFLPKADTIFINGGNVTQVVFESGKGIAYLSNGAKVTEIIGGEIIQK